MYAQLGDFRVSKEPPTVPLTRILRNAVFFKSQNPRKAGPSVSFSLNKSNLKLSDKLTLQVKLSTFITLMTKTRTRRQLSTKNQTMLSWSTFICILPCYFYSWIKLFIYHLLQKNIKVMKIIVKSHLDWELFEWTCGFCSWY